MKKGVLVVGLLLVLTSFVSAGCTWNYQCALTQKCCGSYMPSCPPGYSCMQVLRFACDAAVLNGGGTCVDACYDNINECKTNSNDHYCNTDKTNGTSCKNNEGECLSGNCCIIGTESGSFREGEMICNPSCFRPFFSCCPGFIQTDEKCYTIPAGCPIIGGDYITELGCCGDEANDFDKLSYNEEYICKYNEQNYWNWRRRHCEDFINKNDCWDIDPKLNLNCTWTPLTNNTTGNLTTNNLDGGHCCPTNETWNGSSCVDNSVNVCYNHFNSENILFLKDSNLNDATIRLDTNQYCANISRGYGYWEDVEPY